jgi:hypothetical protein
VATIEKRTRKDGTTAYRLKWRFGGTRHGAQQSITYAEHDDAKSMKGAVEALRHHVYDTDPRVISFELVTGQRPTAYTAPTFGEVAENYVSTRTRAKVTTKELYRRTLRNRAGVLLARPVESITDDDVKTLSIAYSRTPIAPVSQTLASGQVGKWTRRPMCSPPVNGPTRPTSAPPLDHATGMCLGCN